MILVGIDIGKLSHMFCVMDSSTGEFLVNPISFKNNKQGFDSFMDNINSFSKKDVLIGMEDTGHYHFNLLKFLLDSGYAVALINPITTDMTRKMQLGATKDDDLDARLICDVLASNQRRKGYRISKIDSFDLYEQKRLTREHHDLKEQLNVYTNKLQKCIDIVFPEFNSLFRSKYGSVYMNVLKTFGSADSIAHADIRNIRKCFEANRKGRRISLTPEELKEAARNSIGFPSKAEVIELRHLIDIIELINVQISEVDKNRRVLRAKQLSYSHHTRNLTFLWYFHSSGTRRFTQLLKGISGHKICWRFTFQV